MNDDITPSDARSDDVVVDVRQAGDYRHWRDERPGYSETKVFFRTSEFWFAVVGITAILLAAYAEARDSISRDDGWRYAVFLGAAYIISRGLA